jgi:hypothetical protein
MHVCMYVNVLCMCVCECLHQRFFLCISIFGLPDASGESPVRSFVSFTYIHTSYIHACIYVILSWEVCMYLCVYVCMCEYYSKCISLSFSWCGSFFRLVDAQFDALYNCVSFTYIYTYMHACIYAG